MPRISFAVTALVLASASALSVDASASAKSDVVLGAAVPGVSAAARPALATSQSPPYAVNSAIVVRKRFRAAVRALPIARQTPRGYDRSRFGDWRDQDRDCRDTRAEVLAQESRVRVTGGCSIRLGRWFSTYDRRFWRRASDVDIDHLVPLFEAWRSGAKGWAPARRIAYANDLADRRTLSAVTDNVNQSKGDSDPARWLPEYGRCTYVAQYVAVKIRWGLRSDAVEKRAMVRAASHCRDIVISVHKARVVTRTRTGGTGGDGSGLDPRFGTCADAIAHGYGPYRRGVDREYAWYTDADSDGIVCES